MPAPGILTGGNTVGQMFRRTVDTPPTRTGVFGVNPGATPKYAVNRGRIDAEYVNSMARLFIAIPPDAAESFLNTVSPETRPLAQVLLAGSGSNGSGGTGFVDFLLTQAQESLQEKAQIVDTLTDNYVAFYSGHQPPVFQYSGMVLNTYQDDQRVWLLRLYHEILRGTRLANRNAIANLRYDSFLVTGYLENLNLGLSGDNDNSAGTFSFSMRVQRLAVITPYLSSPTVLTTEAVGSDLLSTLYSASARTTTPDTERVAVITPEDPVAPSSSPAASPASQGPNASTTQALQEQGRSTEQIQQAYSEGERVRTESGDTPGPVLQSREEQAQATTQGVERLGAAVTAAQVTTTPATPPALPPAPFTPAFEAQARTAQAQASGRTTRARRSAAAAARTTATPAAAPMSRMPAGSDVMSVPQYSEDGMLTSYSTVSPPVNPSHMSNDGAGGMSNVYNQAGVPNALARPNPVSPLIDSTPRSIWDPATPEQVPPARRSGSRSRGRPSTASQSNDWMSWDRTDR